MYINRVRLRGFKSFGGSHELELAPGYTAIVGPNGSGKSNILDAIRWVLGDNSPARLRISRQNDLIFKGSISTPPSSDVRCTLRLAGGNRLCTIVRSYSPEKGTALEADGVRLRMADLDDIKREWSLDGDQFAFISQGEVSEAIRQRPFQRRIHLEALFGIDRYRKNRDEAQVKLNSAKDELLRLETLVYELKKRREEIGPDVEKAKQAAIISNELDKLRRNYYRVKRRDLESGISNSSKKISELEGLHGWKLFWTEAWRRSLEAENERINCYLKDIKQYEDLEKDIVSRRDEIGRRCFVEAASVMNSKKRIESLRQGDSKTLVEIDNLEIEKKNVIKEKSVLKEKIRAISEEYRKKQIETEDLKKARERSKKKREALEKELKKLRATADGSGNSMISSVNYIRNIRRQNGELETEGRAVELEILSAEKELESEKKNYIEILENHKNYFTECQKQGALVQRLRKEALQMENVVEELRDVSENSAYPESVRYVTSASKLKKLPSAVPLAETFNTPSNIAGAIESYLGGRLFWVVVKTVEDTQRYIEALKRERKGRVTFLPVERCRERSPGFETGDHEGVLGWAIDLLSIEPEWEMAVRHLLGDLLVVEKFETAKRILARHSRSPIVTLEGDVFATGGTISGGHSRKGPGIIEKRNQLREAVESLEKIKEDIHKQQILYMELSEMEGTLASQKNILEEKITDRENDLTKKMNRRDFLLNQSRDLEEMERSHLLELKNSRAARAEARSKITSVRASLVDIPGNSEDFLSEKVIADLENSLKINGEKLNSFNEISKRIELELQRSSSSLEESRAEVKGLEDDIAKSRERLKDSGKKSYALWIELGSLQKKIAETRECLNAAREGHLIKKDRYDHAVRYLAHVESELVPLEKERDSLRRELDDLNISWEERYPVQDCDEDYADADPENLRKELRRLERDLRQLGDFNSGALSEDQSLEKRLSFLDEQMEDVNSGLKEMKEIIRNADMQVHRVFNKALQSIDSNFNLLFQRLFGGGEAHLNTEDSDSLWEAGVNIFARPPGKRLQSLAQLSGGEQTLTAIALLFASMEVAKVPVAILDEVDAALDEVNLRRFVDLLSEYSKTIQMLVMTHRRITMERSELMYGVTLEEPGLSKIVGVRLDDWR